MESGSSPARSRAAVESVGLNSRLDPDVQGDAPEPLHPAYVWVRFTAEHAPANGLDYRAVVDDPAALEHERHAREEAERRLAGVLNLVAERHARKRREPPPPVPAAEVEKPKIDDTVKAKARKALRRGGFLVKTS